jgi:cytosine/adenosine deaminase-related metal-dependent hydrolase
MSSEHTSLASEWPSPDLGYAPAPHTVYTTHPDAIRAVLAAVRASRGRTTVHLAEHSAERTFLTTGAGPFFELATRMRFPIDVFPVPRKGPVDVAAELGLLAPDVLLVHLTDARPDELERIAKSGASVVLCPRSNLYIEVKLPPLIAMLDLGITPALGTDSLASNLSLDVLGEAKALAERFPSVDKARLVAMATWAGARALGRSDLGRLAPGARPGLLAVTGALGPQQDPCAWILRQPAAARRWIARRGSSAKEVPS